jgi:hypothetical protein
MHGVWARLDSEILLRFGVEDDKTFTGTLNA